MPIRVLVADDSITIQKVVTLAFEGEQATVETAGNGLEALERLASAKPDVVLADVFMPGLSGYELCERIKSNPEISRIPVILLAGAFEPFDEREAKRVGYDAHLAKPFDPSELLGMVRSLLTQRPETGTPPTVVDSYAPAPPDAPGFAVSDRAKESFLGTERILDLVDVSFLQRPATEARGETPVAEAPALPTAGPPPGEMVPAGAPESLSEREEGGIEAQVAKILQQVAPGLVREVAERIVPSLVEKAVREYLEAGHLPGNR